MSRGFSKMFAGVAIVACVAGAASADDNGRKDLLSPYGPDDRAAPPAPPAPTILQPYGPHAGTPIPPSRVRRVAAPQPYYAPPPQPYYQQPQPYYQQPQPYYPPQQQPYYYAPAQQQYAPPQQYAPYQQPYYYPPQYYPPQQAYPQPYYPPQQPYYAPAPQPYYAPPAQPYYAPPSPYYAPPPRPPAQLLDPYTSEAPAPPADSAPPYPYYHPPSTNLVSGPTLVASQPPRPKNRLLLKLSLGYGYRYISGGDELHTAAVELTVGSEGLHAGAGGRLGFEAGKLPGGVDFEALTLGPGIEWKLGKRVRLGIAPSLTFQFITDPRYSGTLTNVALGTWLDLSVDLVKNRRGGALYLAGRAGYDWLFGDSGTADSFVARLWLGYRF